MKNGNNYKKIEIPVILSLIHFFSQEFSKTYHDVHYELMDNKELLISKSDRGTCDEFI